jgi:glycosyltransferase involved in cell wall biosynthesis
MSRSQSIAFVCPRFPQGSTLGGAETLMKHLAEEAQTAGHTVRFLTTCAQSHVTWENTLPAESRTFGRLDVEFFPVDDNRDPALFHRLQQRISQGAKLSREDQEQWMNHSVNSTPLYRHLAEHGDDYDVIVMGPYLFGLVYHAAQIHPRKTILVPCLHDEPFAYQAVIRELFSLVKGYIFNTAPEQDLARRLYDLSESSGRVVGIGLASFSANPDAARKKFNLPETYLLYCGRREPLKGTTLLLDYLDVYRERRPACPSLVFTGSGDIDPPPGLRPMVQDLGFVSEEDKHGVMSGALAFVHPSVNESLGIILLESWLAGTPGLVHGGSDVLRWQCDRSGGGLSFRYYPEFEACLDWILEHPNERSAMGRAGKSYVEHEYHPQRVQERLTAALEQIS